ncbi:MAG TPA: ATP-binding cassette domain-containing protein [Chloroflexia bacterium]|nr:ATP-binding cassette domain-containing protein [Chloroflexia bacterium]
MQTSTKLVDENKQATAPVIEVRNLSKHFSDFCAVNDVSFEVHPGEIFGFLGPNGAGKSTTIKILCTLLKPDNGSQVRVAGFEVATQPDAVRQNIGIIFQDPTLDSGLTAQENLDFHCMMYHVPREERAERIKYVLELMDLTSHKDRIVKTFSGGMRRRLEIARGLLHRPHILFLDEPTVGLDPQTRNYIWQYVRQLRNLHGTTIFMTTHYMDEAENCDRIAIIDKGQIVALDTPSALKKMVGEDQVELKTSDNVLAARIINEKYGAAVSVRQDSVVLEIEGADYFVPRLLAELPLLANGLKVETLNVRRPSLEDVFLKLTGRLIREEEGGKKDERRMAMRKRGRL